MKIKKFLTIATGLAKDKLPEPIYEIDELCKGILAIKESLANKGIEYRREETVQSHGIFFLTVRDENQKVTRAEVKIFPVENSETLESYSKVNGKLDFILLHTDEKGEIKVKLVAPHRYYIEIAKGSEYAITRIMIDLEEHEPLIHKINLDRLVNLQQEGWYGGDLHHHSIYRSPTYGGTDPVVETVEEVYNSMQAVGLAYGALSDHHNVKNHSKWKSLIGKDFIPILSKEISTSNGHVMALGVDEDVVYNIPSDEVRTSEYLREEFVRVTEAIKAHGGCPQINHPRDTSKAISFPPEFTDMIQIFETMEIWNGSNPVLLGTTNYKAVQLWIELLNEGRFIPATTGSDTHNIKADDYHEILQEITWLVDIIRGGGCEVPESLRPLASYLSILYQESVTVIENWIQENLGTGGVRTYVYSPQGPSQINILEGLKRGNSFLTNGPILVPSIAGKLPGQTVTKEEVEKGIEIRLIANKPLQSLYIFGDSKAQYMIPLKLNEISKKGYDYSQKIEDIKLQNNKWIIFIAVSDCTNLAITNPIFINQKI